MSEFTDYNFEGKKAIIRVDFNVPLNDQFEITEKHAKMSNDRVQNILRQPSLFVGS